MQSIKNFRPLAEDVTNTYGFKIKKHMIFRSANLDSASPDDLAHLKALGIKVIYDLRSSIERIPKTSLKDFEVKHFNFSGSEHKQPMDQAFLTKVAASGADDFMRMLYQDYLTYAPMIKPLIEDVIKEKRPFLFHCAQGKDRTGVVAALIMLLLDFDEKDVIDEYLKIDPQIILDAEASLRDQHHLSDEIIHALKPLNGVDERFIRVWFEKIKTDYNDFQSYRDAFIKLSYNNVKQFQMRILSKDIDL